MANLRLLHNGQRCGQVLWVKDPLNRTTTFRRWKRGIPEEVERADGELLGRTITDDGWIVAIEDWNGVSIGYDYDDAGRLTKIDLPSPWNDTNILYTPGTGTLDQRATRGSYRVTTTYDAMLRPITVREQAISGGGGNIYSFTQYDDMGREALKSLPYTWNNTSPKGIRRDTTRWAG